MGTSNFYYKNASRVYAICMNYEQPKLDDDMNETDETETVAPEEYEIKDRLDYIREKLIEGKKFKPVSLDGWDSNSPRSFPATYLAQWSSEKSFNDISVEIILQATANSGYYEGACLDWSLKTYVGGLETDVDYIKEDDFRYSDDANVGLATIMMKHAVKWLNKTTSEMTSDIEKIFEDVCEIKLRHIATFSNGETFYETENKAS